MIPVSHAIEIVLGETARLADESIELRDTVGRILGQDIIADTDLPPFDRSQMDGFAVVAADTADMPVKLKIVGESAAGKGWHAPIRSGEAVRIMTGAPVPPGADAVQKVELTSEAAGPDGRAWNDESSGSAIIEIRGSVKPEANIVRRGSEIQVNDIVFARGERISTQMIAPLASFGYARVSVATVPRVGILATGTEIVEVGERPGADQIRNSNAPMLAAIASASGGTARTYPLTTDNVGDLKTAISAAMTDSDMLVMTGGVSVGKYDLTKLALRELGASILFEKVCLKPGKPTVFAKLDGKLVFGLPGNPVSAAVTFYLFVRAAMLKAQGALDVRLRAGRAVVAANVKAARERDTYLPARLGTDADGRLTATPLKWLGSSDFIGFARADALIFVAAGERLEAGEVATICFL